MKLYVDGLELEFGGREEVKDFFGLDEYPTEHDMTLIDGKHVCVDPYGEDIHNTRALMYADTAEQLSRDYKESCDDI